MADGMPIESAIGQGRKRINEIAPTWGIPSLYLQSGEPFTIKPLSDAGKAERLWQRSQKVSERERRKEIIAQILKLDPNHAGGKAAQQRFDNEDQSEERYAAAETYYQNQQWREAYRVLEQIEHLVPNYRSTRTLLAEVLGKLGGQVSTTPQGYAAQQEEYRPILNALLEGRLVPFLGWDVSRFGRPTQDSWVQGYSLPSANEVALALAQRLTGVAEGVHSLPQASQITSLIDGESALYDRLSTLYQGEHHPNMLHRLLAELPSRLGKQRHVT